MVFAEKIVTAVQRGTVNTRWRDYADIALLSATHDVDGDELSASIDLVATHRKAALIPLDEALAGYVEIAQEKWRSWVRKQRLTDRLPEDFAIILQEVLVFAGPAVRGTTTGQTWVHHLKRWTPSEVRDYVAAKEASATSRSWLARVRTIVRDAIPAQSSSPPKDVTASTETVSTQPRRKVMTR